MECQNCHEQEATVVITKITGEQHSITHLCKTCANDLGGAGGVAISIQMVSEGSEPTGACASCGKTFAEFKKSGLFGCEHCYTQFEPHLQKLFKRVQGVTAHVTAAAPADPSTVDSPSVDEKKRVAAEMSALETALSEAVSSEDFERAAEIRDRLATLRESGQAAT